MVLTVPLNPSTVSAVRLTFWLAEPRLSVSVPLFPWMLPAKVIPESTVNASPPAPAWRTLKPLKVKLLLVDVAGVGPRDFPGVAGVGPGQGVGVVGGADGGGMMLENAQTPVAERDCRFTNTAPWPLVLDG